ncbi:hypothetical protein GCM10022254_74720 [Actinomadura meridiana]|uniref:Integral membrane protein n=1 Tax=Actinomadura meridiana TaxID=559626 RepID=A0ABP8CQP2_9ACTN
MTLALLFGAATAVSAWRLFSILRPGREKEGPVPVAKILIRLALTFLCGAGAVYGGASLWYSGAVFRDRVCDYAGNYDQLPVSSDHVPLSTKCLRGGTVVEIVPSWVNPALAVLVSAAAAAAAAALTFGLSRQGRQRPDR